MNTVTIDSVLLVDHLCVATAGVGEGSEPKALAFFGAVWWLPPGEVRLAVPVACGRVVSQRL